jgi:DNA-binding transcriptional LysR family regulator
VNLVQLKRMIAIYESGSLRKASKAVGITQPALTLSIRQLEEEFNTTLFERGPTGVRPTAMCEQLVQRARLMLMEEQRILSDLAAAHRVPKVSVGVHPIIMNDMMSRAMRQFIDQVGHLDMWVREGYTTQLLDLLSAGELDFAFCGLPEGYGSETFAFEPLFTREYAVVAVPDHPVFAMDESDFAQGTDFVWAHVSAYETADPIDNDDVVTILRKFGYRKDCKAVKASSTTFVKTMILYSGMIGMVACEAVADELANGSLKRLPGSEIPAPAFGFITLNDRYETRTVRQLKAAIRQCCARKPI